MAEAEDEVRVELEAVAAVYGEDCRVVRDFPPHLVIDVRPRTADDSSQQFVEFSLGIEASSQYPKEPPHVYAVETKGLDEHRQAYLIRSIQKKAEELSSCPMLVTLCEEAVEILSNMNHPAGDCPLCLYPLVAEGKDGSALPFMKLMSCFHCFHSECIMRWWKWLQHDGAQLSKSRTTVTAGDIYDDVNHHKGFCPVCRKVFDENDIEHVHDLLGANSFQLASLAIDLDDDEKVLLHSKSEENRRKQYDSVLKVQKERNGLTEPKKDLVIQPGMYVPLPPTAPTTAAGDNNDLCEGTSTSEVESSSLQNHINTTKQNNSGARRRNRAHGSRRQPRGEPAKQQWQRRGAHMSHQ